MGKIRELSSAMVNLIAAGEVVERPASAAKELLENAIDAGATRVGITVSNVGDPIPADQLERIFDRFHRGSTLRARHGEGAGLGLAITRSIVRAHGGEIYARNKIDGGAEFRFWLPAEEESNT